MALQKQQVLVDINIAILTPKILNIVLNWKASVPPIAAGKSGLLKRRHFVILLETMASCYTT